VSTYAERRGGSARYVPGGRVWEVPADVALPSATQNELNADDAATLIRNGVKAVSEGANMPTTPDAVDLLQQAGVAFGPGKAANAGGVAVSALEMTQNASRTSWKADHVEAELARIMTDIHTTCAETAERYGLPGDYVAGANIAGFERVADAMLAQGII
jgi:glutamate dehydrogenase (NADP+)